MGVPTMADLDATGQTVGLRVDINSPVTEAGTLADDARLRAHIDTIAELCEAEAAVGILAHQGRPGGDEFVTLRSHADRLDTLLDAPVGYCDATFSRDARERLYRLDGGSAVLLENTRFYSEEYMEFDPTAAAQTHLVDRLAPVFDAFVNDAFAAAHRSQPSMVGFPQRLPSYAGRVMERELDLLGDIESTPTPRLYVFGGAKVEGAVSVIKHVLERDLADAVLTAGLVGNLFLVENGVDLGDASRTVLADRVGEATRATARDILRDHRDRVALPSDLAYGSEGDRIEVGVPDLPVERAVAFQDIGSETIDDYESRLAKTGTAILNGPAGVFEHPTTAWGTKRVFRAVAEADYSIVGGGDSAAAIRRFDIDGFDHVSTGGGAALRMLANDPLPAVEALR